MLEPPPTVFGYEQTLLTDMSMQVLSATKFRTTAGMYVSTNNGVTWTTYKMFTVPTGGYFGSPTASNFVQGIMYYSCHFKQRLPKRHRNLSSLRHIEHSGKCPPPCRSAFTIKRCHTSTNTFTFKLRWPHNSFSHWILQNPKTNKIHFCTANPLTPSIFLFEKLLNP